MLLGIGPEVTGDSVVIHLFAKRGISQPDLLRQKPSCRPVCKLFAWNTDLSAFPPPETDVFGWPATL
jgi:hypothetical protein